MRERLVLVDDDPGVLHVLGVRLRAAGYEILTATDGEAGLEAVKAHRAVTSAFDRERASGFAHTLGFWWSVADLEYYMGYVDNMAGQSVADLRAYGGKYIVGKPRVTGVLIDPASRRRLALTTDELMRGGAN